MAIIGEQENDPRMLEVLKATEASGTGTYMQVEREYDDMRIYEPDDDIMCALGLGRLTCRRLRVRHCEYATDDGKPEQMIFTVRAGYRLHTMDAQVIVNKRDGGWWVTHVSAQIRDTRPRANYHDEVELWASTSPVAIMSWDARLRRMDREQPVEAEPAQQGQEA